MDYGRTVATWPIGEEIAGEADTRRHFPQDLDALPKYNGLSVEQMLGDTAEMPFGARATKQLIICRATNA
jgi:hypothetical protein